MRPRWPSTIPGCQSGERRTDRCHRHEFGLGIWEDVASRENWKVADWSEAEESLIATATYEWVRLDTDLEWIKNRL